MRKNRSQPFFDYIEKIEKIEKERNNVNKSLINYKVHKSFNQTYEKLNLSNLLSKNKDN
jgi:hypothetical protein